MAACALIYSGTLDEYADIYAPVPRAIGTSEWHELPFESDRKTLPPGSEII